VTFEVFIAVFLKIQVLRDVTPCRLVSTYWFLSLKLKALQIFETSITAQQ